MTPPVPVADFPTLLLPHGLQHTSSGSPQCFLAIAELLTNPNSNSYDLTSEAYNPFIYLWIPLFFCAYAGPPGVFCVYATAWNYLPKVCFLSHMYPGMAMDRISYRLEPTMCLGSRLICYCMELQYSFALLGSIVLTTPLHQDNFFFCCCMESLPNWTTN